MEKFCGACYSSAVSFHLGGFDTPQRYSIVAEILTSCGSVSLHGSIGAGSSSMGFVSQGTQGVSNLQLFLNAVPMLTQVSVVSAPVYVLASHLTCWQIPRSIDGRCPDCIRRTDTQFIAMYLLNATYVSDLPQPSRAFSS